jgi:hypothetical protein
MLNCGGGWRAYKFWSQRSLIHASVYGQLPFTDSSKLRTVYCNSALVSPQLDYIKQENRDLIGWSSFLSKKTHRENIHRCLLDLHTSVQQDVYYHSRNAIPKNF